jgi:hypothetical protein
MENHREWWDEHLERIDLNNYHKNRTDKDVKADEMWVTLENAGLSEAGTDLLPSPCSVEDDLVFVACYFN